MTVTPDAVEAAARLVFPDEFRKFDWWRSLEPGRPVLNSIDRDEAELIARVAAAAPLIAQQTLLDAAEEVRLTCPPCGPDGPTDEIHQAVIDTVVGVHALITARAATLTPKEN